VPVERKLSPEKAKSVDMPRVQLDEVAFRWLHNEDAMASDKLAEGIRRFDADARKLEKADHLARRRRLPSPRSSSALRQDVGELGRHLDPEGGERLQDLLRRLGARPRMQRSCVPSTVFAVFGLRSE